VADVLVRYATGIDRRDWALFRTCFTEDCEADYGAIGAWHGVDAITDWMERTHQPCGHTLHRITNTAMVPDGDGISARSYVDAIVMAADNQRGTRAAGYYDDELVSTDDGWKIARRQFTLVLLQLNLEGASFGGPRA
jgi:3-phenylpropionate/cinnamic acid dioxygenase small subunit